MTESEVKAIGEATIATLVALCVVLPIVWCLGRTTAGTTAKPAASAQAQQRP